MSRGQLLRTSRVISRLLGIRISWVVTAVLVLALAVSGLLGGLNRVDHPSITPVAVGTSFDTGQMKVTVLRARLVRNWPHLPANAEGERWLAVLARLELNGDETWTHLSDTVQLTPTEGVTRPEPDLVILARDSSRTNQLQPGMPEEVAFLWPQSTSAPIPATVTVQLKTWAYELMHLTENVTWQPKDLTAEVSVPVINSLDGRK